MKITMKQARREYRLCRTTARFREWLRNKFRDDYVNELTYDNGSKVEKIVKSVVERKDKIKKSGVRYACEMDGWTSANDGLDCCVCHVKNNCPFEFEE